MIYERDQHISYSGCGLPYYIGGEVESIDELTPRSPAFFKKKYNVDVLTGHEVLELDASSNQIVVQNLATGKTFTEHYGNRRPPQCGTC